MELGRPRGKTTPASNAEPAHPKCLGRRETRRASEGPRERTAPSDHRTRTWVLVVEVSLAEAGRTHLWSMTCCVRREAWSQAARERRSGLDLATEQFAHPSFDGVRTRPRRTGARGSIRGVEAAFEFRRGRKTSCAIRQKASWSGGSSLLTGRRAHASGRCGEGRRSSQDGVCRSALVGRSRRERAAVATEDVRGRFAVSG